MKTNIEQLRGMGYLIQLDGDSIIWRFTGTGQPDPEAAGPLLAELRQRKAEAIEALKAEQEPQPLHIFSRILNAEIWVVPEGFQGHLDGPVYTDAEVRELDRLSVTGEQLRTIHAVRVELDGEIVPQEPEYEF